MAWQDAGRLEDLKDGVPSTVQIGPQQVLLVRDGDRVHACDALCPHKFGPLVDGTYADGCLTCPLHAASFDLASGDPDEEWAGHLPVYPTRVQGEAVEVRLP